MSQIDIGGGSPGLVGSATEVTSGLELSLTGGGVVGSEPLNAASVVDLGSGSAPVAEMIAAAVSSAESGVAGSSVVAVLDEVQRNTSELVTLVQMRGLEFCFRILGAILIWVAGRALIRFTLRIVEKTSHSRRVDPTLTRYLLSALNGAAVFLLVMVVLGWVGVETATFAALLAGAGLAIGTAWGGLLQHFAAGMFMVVLRPFRVGDVISAAGVTGTVVEVGLVVTTITTFDNVRTVVGNNRIFSGSIENYSATPYRRVELSVIVDHGTDLEAVASAIRERVERVENVLEEPPPMIEIEAFTLAGPRVVVRPFCDNRFYWPVLFGTNRAIHQAMREGGYAIPSQRYQVESPLGRLSPDASGPEGGAAR